MNPPEQPQGQDPFEAETLRVTGILESIAANYPGDSEEVKALQTAAMAFTTVQLHESMRMQYQSFVADLGGQLNEQQKEDLRQHGIEPDYYEKEE